MSDGVVHSISEWLDRVDTTSSDVKRRARILLISLLVMNVSSLGVSAVAFVFAPPGRKLPTMFVSLMLGAISFLAAHLTRRGYVDAAGILVGGSLSAMIVLYQLHVGMYTGFLWYMILSVVIGSISLRPRLILVVGAGNILLLVVLGVLLPIDAVERYRVSVIVAALLAPTTVLTYYSASRVRDTLLKQESTMGELELAKRELVVANQLLELRVQERTADLEEKNERLQETLASLQRAQEQLVQSEKMASLGMVVAGVAHELRNPLNFVNNFAELSLEYAEELEGATSTIRGGGTCTELVSEVLPDLIDNLRRIHTHGRRAESIVSAMQLHGRGSGTVRSEERSERVELATFVRDHCELAIQGFRGRHAAFECEVQEEFSLDVGAISTRSAALSRVIVNLVDNACYAMFARAQKDASRPPLLKLRTWVDGGEIVLEVEDNGAGIPEEVRRKVFDPFFTTKPPGEGTGLGLSISYDVVVKQLGGRLEVGVGAGGGALFRVRLSSARPGEAAAEAGW